MITIESIGNAPYAAKLREKLCTEWTLDTLLFADKLKLFPDAKWQSNRIFVFRSTRPTSEHRVRRLHATGVGANQLTVEPIDQIGLDGGPGRVFSLRAAVDLDTSQCVPLQRICYVTFGMRLNSTDKYAAGALVEVPKGFAAEGLGWERVDATHVRFKPFLKEDVISEEKDDRHPRPLIDTGDDLSLDGGFEALHWLEYGDHWRIPRFAYRPTFCELYEREKLIVGRFTGAAWDDGSRVGFLCTSHSVTLALRWCALESIDRSVITEAVAEMELTRGAVESLSRGFSLGYLLALFISAPVQAWLAANRRSMKEDVYPDDLKAIPVPNIPPDKQTPFVSHAKRLQELAWRLYDLRCEGVRVTSSGKVTVPVATWTKRILEQNPSLQRIDLFQSSSTLFEFTDSHMHHPLAGARAKGTAVIVGKEVIARLRPGIANPDAVARWLAAFLAEVDGTFATVQHEAKVPRDRTGIQRVIDAIAATEEEVRRILDERRTIREDIDRRAWALYRRTPPVRDGGPQS